MTDTNAPDAPAGVSTHTVYCIGHDNDGWSPLRCGATYEYRDVARGPVPEPHPPTGDPFWLDLRDAVVRDAVAHLAAHTGWTAAAVRGRDGHPDLHAWCPDHHDDPDARRHRDQALAAELRATVTEADTALAGHPVLGGPAPGTRTHALLLEARAHALAGLAALAAPAPRVLTPMECHGTTAFCSRCSPRDNLRNRGGRR